METLDPQVPTEARRVLSNTDTPQIEASQLEGGAWLALTVHIWSVILRSASAREGTGDPSGTVSAFAAWMHDIGKSSDAYQQYVNGRFSEDVAVPLSNAASELRSVFEASRQALALGESHVRHGSRDAASEYAQGLDARTKASPASETTTLRSFDEAIDRLASVARDASTLVARNSENLAFIRARNNRIEGLVAVNQATLDRLVGAQPA